MPSVQFLFRLAKAISVIAIGLISTIGLGFYDLISIINYMRFSGWAMLILKKEVEV